MKEFVLGPEADFERLPAPIELDRRFYFVVKDGDQYRLVSRKCPHAGALVDFEDGELVCPMHGWCFDPHTGACVNVPTRSLTAYPVTLRDGQLIAQVDV